MGTKDDRGSSCVQSYHLDSLGDLILSITIILSYNSTIALSYSVLCNYCPSAKALTKQEEPKQLLGCSKNDSLFKIAAFYALFSREEFNAMPSKTKVADEKSHLLP